jgi:selenoprotein W-related protein
LTDTVLPKFKQRITSWTMVPSDGGKFELSLDGELIYSKKKEGRFPTNEEIVALLEKKLAKSR